MEQKGNTAHIVAIVVLILVIVYFAFIRGGSEESQSLSEVDNTASASDSVTEGDISTSQGDNVDTSFIRGEDLTDNSPATNIFTPEVVSEVTPVEEERPQYINVDVYFANDSKNLGGVCSEVFKVTRSVLDQPRVGTAALSELLNGPSPVEVASGYLSDIPSGTLLNSLTISGGVARADFNSLLESDQGECSGALRKAQISNTLLQFPTVDTVIISVNGNTANSFTSN